MTKSCENCVYYVESLTREDVGTCHRNSPKMIDPADLGEQPDDAKADAIELRRWPGVFAFDVCGRHRQRCRADDCREPGVARTGGDVLSGRWYCDQHVHMRREAAA
jgi:hypothetical protein